MRARVIFLFLALLRFAPEPSQDEVLHRVWFQVNCYPDFKLTWSVLHSDLPVLFPYPRIYPEQYAYMRDLKKTLDAGGHCVLEMPSGTGKTVSLLSLIVAYQQHYPEHRKLIYCSRTMSEIEKALAELKALMEHRAKELGHEEEFRALGLTSRKNLCLHPSVKREKSGTVVDARCRSLTAGFVKEKKERGEDVELCVYHEVSLGYTRHNIERPNCL